MLISVKNVRKIINFVNDNLDKNKVKKEYLSKIIKQTLFYLEFVLWCTYFKKKNLFIYLKIKYFFIIIFIVINIFILVLKSLFTYLIIHFLLLNLIIFWFYLFFNILRKKILKNIY